jgi:hypothetical protein
LSVDSALLLKKAVLTASRSEAAKTKAQWKKHIRTWENTFRLERTADPTADDKQRIKNWYTYYKALAALEVDVEKQQLMADLLLDGAP